MNYEAASALATQKFTPAQCRAAYTAMAKWIDNRIESNLRPTMLVLPMQGAMIVSANILPQLEQPCTYRAVSVGLYGANNIARQSAEFKFWPIEPAEIELYDFIVIDDVAETLRTFEAMRDRLMFSGAQCSLVVTVDKPVPERVKDLTPDFAPLNARASEWLLGEGMDDCNDGNDEAAATSESLVRSQSWRATKGIWVKR